MSVMTLELFEGLFSYKGVANMAYKILIAEDELHIRNLIKDYLTNEGMEVLSAANGEQAVRMFMKETGIDLVILDIMMPKKNGWEVCEEIRMISQVPVLFLTALSEVKDELKGLNIGADDYVTKPFRYEIFMARVKSILRRTAKNQNEPVQIGSCIIDQEKRAVYCGEQLVDLSPKEYELLTYFVKNANHALERQQILDAVWGYEFYGDPRTIDSHVKNLRSKLGDVGDLIKSVRGFGYKLEVAAVENKTL